MKPSANILTGLILAMTLLVLVGCGLGVIEVCIEGSAGCSGTPQTSMMVADFDACTGINNLGGEMSTAYNAPDSIMAEYLETSPGDCILQLTYEIDGWAAYWLILDEADFSSYHHLTFDIRSESEQLAFKIEMKNYAASGQQIEIIYVDEITPVWQTVEVHLSDFEPANGSNNEIPRNQIHELVFVFEPAHSKNKGTVYLDNIMLTP